MKILQLNGFQRIAGRWWHILSLNAARGHAVAGVNLGAAKVLLLGFLLILCCETMDFYVVVSKIFFFHPDPRGDDPI